MRRSAHIAVRVLAVLAGIAAAYAIVGLIGGAIPANSDWHPPARGVTVFVESNGIHVGIVVPKVAAGVDWRRIAPASDLADPRYAAFDHLAVGWGEKSFYLGTPTWADVKPSTILAAAVGSDETLLHVEHIATPVSSRRVRAIVLRPNEYRRLAAAIGSRFATHGRRYPGYSRHDAFYEATGHYDAISTCNAWAGSALRSAGVRTGVWTPFSATVMWWF